MPFLKLQFRPGLFRDGTRYSAEGTWFDSDKVRFRRGSPEKIGGWEKFTSDDYLGSARMLHDWGTIGGSKYVGVGTSLKLYVNNGDTLYDITPVRLTATLGTNPITTTNGTGVISIAHTAHGAVLGDYVTLSGATTTNGIPDTDINVEHKIVEITDDDNYKVVCATAATSSGTGGGSSVVAEYEINTGLDDYVQSSGWGAGSWGSGTWGGSTALGANSQLRLWSLVNFGDDMIASVRGGGVYYWDQSGGVSTPAIALHELTRRSITLGSNPIATTNLSATITITDNGGHGAGVGDKVTLGGSSAVNGIPAGDINKEHEITATPTDTTFQVVVDTAATSTGTGGGSSVTAAYDAGEFYTPTKGLQVMISDVARHVLVFGANPIGSSTIDPLFVRWCSSENAADWNPTEVNTAGGQRLSTGSEFVGAIGTRYEILAFTDTGITSVRYVGGDFVFSFSVAATGVSMISPNAAVAANGRVYFMDHSHFHVYGGSVGTLGCPLRDFIFSNIDQSQAFKVFAGTNEKLSEVAWFYPSVDGGGEIDRYVLYNYEENLWSIGSLARGFWSNAYTQDNPIATTLNKTTLGNNPISTTSASTTVTITHTSHGLSVGDIVILSGASDTGGIDELVLNDQHTIATVPDADSYTIEVPDSASSTDTGGGGSVQELAPNYLYSHEVGHDADGEAFTAYIESGDADIGDGDNFWFIRRMIPDVEFRDSDDPNDAVTISLKGRNFPGETLSTIVSESITSTTTQKHVRGRARQIVFRVESSGSGYGWRLGHPRLDVRPDGRR